MEANQQHEFRKKYMSNVKLDLSFAARTKVHSTWQDEDFIPEFYKFYYILEGEGYVKIEDQIFYPQPGELYLLPAGVRQSYGNLDQNHRFDKYWCHFHATIGDLPFFQILRVPTSIRVNDNEAMRLMFEQLILYANSDELTSEMRVHATLLSLIAMFIEQADYTRWNISASTSFEKMSDVLRYIDNHLNDNLSVEILAQIAHFHPNYFIRVFKQFTGYSPIQFINSKRLDKAKNLLAVTELSITSIADEMHMDLSYFSRMFKEHTGFSPSNYRELIT